MPRLSPPDPNHLSAEQRRVCGEIAGGPRGGVRGPLAVWLHRPDLADKAQALGRYCRYETSLPARLSELAILITASEWRAEYEWSAHVGHARAGGLSDAVIEAVRTGAEPPFEVEDEAAVHAFARELYATRQVSDETYRRAVEAIGEAGIVDLTGLLGYYALISITINVFHVPPPEGAASAFP